jgi:hypothetical protein
LHSPSRGAWRPDFADTGKEATSWSDLRDFLEMQHYIACEPTSTGTHFGSEESPETARDACWGAARLLGIVLRMRHADQWRVEDARDRKGRAILEDVQGMQNCVLNTDTLPDARSSPTGARRVRSDRHLVCYRSQTATTNYRCSSMSVRRHWYSFCRAFCGPRNEMMDQAERR